MRPGISKAISPYLYLTNSNWRIQSSTHQKGHLIPEQGHKQYSMQRYLSQAPKDEPPHFQCLGMVEEKAEAGPGVCRLCMPCTCTEQEHSLISRTGQRKEKSENSLVSGSGKGS